MTTTSLQYAHRRFRRWEMGRIEGDRVLLLIRDPLDDLVYRGHVYRVPDLGDDDGLVEVLIRSRQSDTQDLRRQTRDAQRYLRMIQENDTRVLRTFLEYPLHVL